MCEDGRRQHDGADAGPKGRGPAILAAGWLAVVAAGAALGASAAPSAEPGPDQLDANVEAWLDVPIPADATVGEPYAFGVTMWNRT